MNKVAESLCGWRASDAAGRPLADVFRIVNENTREPVESPVDRVLAEGVTVGLANHTILVARDGSERPIDDSGAPIRGLDGRVNGVVLVFRDVTERRQADARIAEEVRRKDEFLAMLAHELRNPLAAIANAVQILLHPDAVESQPWCREVIDRQVRQLTRLVDDLLDISRVSRGKIELRPQRVDMAFIVRSAAQAVRPLVDERRHELHLSIDPEAIELDADPVRLEQVFVNLFNNAAKYTEPGGRIAIEATLDASHAVVRVTDTGIGIPPDLLAPRLRPVHPGRPHAVAVRGGPGHRPEHGPEARRAARRPGRGPKRRPRPGQPPSPSACRPWPRPRRPRARSDPPRSSSLRHPARDGDQLRGGRALSMAPASSSGRWLPITRIEPSASSSRTPRLPRAISARSPSRPERTPQNP